MIWLSPVHKHTELKEYILDYHPPEVTMKYKQFDDQNSSMYSELQNVMNSRIIK